MDKMQPATDQEIQLIDQMRKNVSDLCLEKHHLETKNLLRFIRARNHSIPKAENMFRRYIEWRDENDIDRIIDWEYPKEFKTTYWPWYFPGFDNLDGPVLIICFGQWDPSKVGANYNDFVKYLLQCFESVWTVMQKKAQGQKTHQQFSCILDLKGLNFRHVTTIDAMQGVLEAVKAFEGNFPETLRIGLILNAPYVFSLAWRLIKPFVSEYTEAKLKFLGSDIKTWRQELTKYIPENQIYKRYGGTLPDTEEVILKNGCAIVKGSDTTNSNEYISTNKT